MVRRRYSPAARLKRALFAVCAPLCAAALFASGCATTSSAVPDRAATRAARLLPRAVAPAVKVAAETTVKTPSGAHFVVPAGWTTVSSGNVQGLVGPEGEVHLWLAEVDVDAPLAAIQAAWKIAAPDMTFEVDRVQSVPLEKGWDEVVVVQYKVPAAQSRVVQAVAQRKGDVVYVTLVDTPIAAAQRRGAHIAQILGSFERADAKVAEKRVAHAWDAQKAAALDAFVSRALQKSGVPGAAVAVVQNGKVVFERGYGAADDHGAPVTPQTRFMIGSNSKAFTSLLMARAVDAGVAAWETPVHTLLPSFALATPALTAKVTMADSVCACTGLPRQDLEMAFEYADGDPTRRLAELAGMTPTTAFGETFQYSNALVAAGGYAVAHALQPEAPLGEAYPAALAAHVLEPLGLTHTSVHAMNRAPEGHALPHGRGAFGAYHPMPLSYENFAVSVAPAGALWSTTGDLARVMAMELANGRAADGSVFVTPAQIERRRARSVKIGHKSHYGLGLMASERDGTVAVGHGGNTFGFTTENTFFPEHDFGVIVLANAQYANLFTGSVFERAVELVFEVGGEDVAAEKRFDAAHAQAAESFARQKDKLKPVPAALAAKARGTYVNGGLGKVTIEGPDDALVLDAGEWRTGLMFTDADGAPQLVATGAPMSGVPFTLQEDGTLLLDAGQQTYTFTPAAAP